MGWMPNLGKLDEQLAQAREKQAAIAARKARNDGDLKDAYISMKSEGSYTLRLLPTWRKPGNPLEDAPPMVEVVDHMSLPPEKGKGGYRCIRETPSYAPEAVKRGIGCPICEAMDKLRAKGIKSFGRNPYKQQSAYVGALDLSRGDKVPRIATLKPRLYHEIMGDFVEYLKLDPPVNPFDLEAGLNVKITRTGTGLDTVWSRFVMPRPVPAGNSDEIAKIKVSIWDLDRLYRFPTDEKLKAAETAAEAMYEYFLARGPDAESEETDDSADAKVDARATVGHAAKAGASQQYLQAKSDKPACYGNNVVGYSKCNLCDVELDCQEVLKARGGKLDPKIPKPQDVPDLY